MIVSWDEDDENGDDDDDELPEAVPKELKGGPPDLEPESVHDIVSLWSLDWFLFSVTFGLFSDYSSSFFLSEVLNIGLVPFYWIYCYWFSHLIGSCFFHWEAFDLIDLIKLL